MRLEIAAIFVICFAALWIGSDCQACDPGMGLDPSDGVSCYACDDPQCADCLNDYATCQTCNSRYGKNGAVCESCKTDCYACSDSIDTCTECSYSNYGPDGSGACAACSPNCANCFASGSGKCDSCDPYYTFDTATHTTCEPCETDCQECTRTGPGNCDSCPTNTGSDNGIDTTPEHCEPCEQANCLNCYAYSRNCDFCIMPLTRTADGFCKPTNLQFIYREQWWAQGPSSPLTRLPWRQTPVDKVVVHHTHNDDANDDSNCEIRTKAMQNDQRNGRWSLYLPDIAYHFLICGNGKVLVGLGWNYEAKQRKSFPFVTYEIAMLGNFEKKLPTAAAVASLNELIDHGKPYNIADDAKVYAHWDVSCRSCPGKMFYESGTITGRPDYGGIYKKDCGPHSRGAGHSSRR